MKTLSAAAELFHTTDRRKERQTEGDTNRKSEANGRSSQFCKGTYKYQEVTKLLSS